MERKNAADFLAAWATTFIFCVSDFVMLVLIKNDVKPKQSKENGVSLSEVIKNTLGNKSFFFLFILWEIL